MTTTEIVRDEAFVRKLNQGFLECRTMRHAYKIEFFGPMKNAPVWLQKRSKDYTSVVVALVKICIRCELANVQYMNATNGKRVQSGEPFRPFNRRNFYPNDYLWNGKTSPLDRPVGPDFTKELYRRWRNEHTYE